MCLVICFARRDDTLLISQTGCICGKEGLGAPHSKPQAASQRVAVRMPMCGRNLLWVLPPSPSSLRSFRRNSAAPPVSQMGGIGMLLDIMSAGDSEQKPHQQAQEQESDADADMSEAEGSEVEACG